MLGRADILPDIFLILSHAYLIGVSVDSYGTHSAHYQWHIFWLKSCPTCACDVLKTDQVSPLTSLPCQILLYRELLAFKASLHSSSNQRFDFLGIVVPLVMLFSALVMCLTKDSKGSASSKMSSAIMSKQRSWNHSQSALVNTQCKGAQLDWVSAPVGRIEVSIR